LKKATQDLRPMATSSEIASMHDSSISRRGFLDTVTMILLAIIGLFLVIPAIWYMLAPVRTRGGKREFVDVGSLAAIPKGEWQLLSLELVQEDGWRQTKTRHAVWVRRDGETDREVAVRSSICPHLGCPVNWDPARKEFRCPCHGGIFDVSGSKISGPPPRGLDPLDFEIRSGRLWVRWQDFKIGADKPIEVNL
jgi:menaquinol-cytochrome c reductase iron-sulfur subunit